MSFLTLGALLVGLLVGAPVLAHLLRRKQAEERLFPPAHLVPPTAPSARRRSLLEDRALFVTRAISVLLLAILGATPFVHCSRLAVMRRGGASVALALVIDDSLSMRASLPGPGGKPRFARALEGARELLKSLGPGDAVAIVLAGAPARVALGSTTNMAAVEEALDSIEASDRATDLDQAVQLARGLLRGLAQRDKRVVLLSDMADGSPADAAPLVGDPEISLWAPLPELEARGADCAVTRADRSGKKVWARVVCSAGVVAAPVGSASTLSPSPSEGRKVELRAGGKVLASVALGPAVKAEEVALDLPAGAPEELKVGLTGSDSIAEDDEAPVVTAGGALPMGVVVDAALTRAVTGGPPPIEQALAAMELDAQVRPLPGVPEHAEELNNFAALIIDDPPGFTPEHRRTLAAWVERGGVALITLGPRAAAAPLGAGFDPLLPGVVRWGPSPAKGIEGSSAPILGMSAEGMEDLDPRGRASLDPEALAGADVLASWKDGPPLLIRRARGRGAVLAATLPLSVEESDLVLRPAFLALLDRFVSTARARGGARRIEVGEAWVFDGYKAVKVSQMAEGAAKPRAITVSDGARPGADPKANEAPRRLRAEPPRAGLYDLELDGERSTRVAAIPDREIDLRVRPVQSEARAASLGGVLSSLDFSPYVALGLLGLLAVELLLRVVGQGRRESIVKA